MKRIVVEESLLTVGAEICSRDDDGVVLRLSEKGAGFVLPGIAECEQRYLTFNVEVHEDHSLPMHFLVYVHGEKGPAFTVRFGLLPRVNAKVCLDLNWMEGGQLFPEALPGTLKIVCHGRRVHRDEVERVVLSTLPSFHDVTLRLGTITLTDVRPDGATLPDVKLVDEFGQSKWKSWPGKTEDVVKLGDALLRQEDEGGEYPFDDWTEYGGWKKKRLHDGTGFFSRCKHDGRWWLTDPEGYAFFSMGPDCVGMGGDCRIDGVEKWLDWLPDRDDAIYGEMFTEGGRRRGVRRMKTFSFFKANLYRAFGEGWYERWRRMLIGQLKCHGMNTLGNWSDSDLLGATGIPYVTSLPRFPYTELTIFRDFPDVFSEEYERCARECAAALEKRRDDPYMIGYFLRNEPEWAFVDNLVLADEVLYNPDMTSCKRRLVSFLKERYSSIESLNRAWGTSLYGFDELFISRRNVSKLSKAAADDMREFSRMMLRAYVEIPVRECRRVDPNHMILGMRWAWISDPDIVTGWENFDVFSINCYAVDPTSAIENVVRLGVDLPVLIGEFHFGALDAGLPATGLEAVLTQHDRGIAYRRYVESVAAHPNGVGCHYFQCYDQFTLGRFDGENYNIGLFDICSRAYPEMMSAIKICAERMYSVADGTTPKCNEMPRTMPMIAY